ALDDGQPRFRQLPGMPSDKRVHTRAWTICGLTGLVCSRPRRGPCTKQVHSNTMNLACRLPTLCFTPRETGSPPQDSRTRACATDALSTRPAIARFLRFRKSMLSWRLSRNTQEANFVSKKDKSKPEPINCFVKSPTGRHKRPGS